MNQSHPTVERSPSGALHYIAYSLVFGLFVIFTLAFSLSVAYKDNPSSGADAGAFAIIFLSPIIHILILTLMLTGNKQFIKKILLRQGDSRIIRSSSNINIDKSRKIGRVGIISAVVITVGSLIANGIFSSVVGKETSYIMLCFMAIYPSVAIIIFGSRYLLRPSRP